MRGSYAIDAAFMTSLIRDIVNVRFVDRSGVLRRTTTLQGLNFIHASILHVHGHLNSSNCLVDDRWAVKISDFGTSSLFELEPLTQKSKSAD